MMFFSVVAVAGALLLTGAGAGHLRHGPSLRAALAAQGLLPRRLQRRVAGLTTVLEVGVGGSVLATQLTPALPVPVRAVPLIVQAGMYLAFTAYLSAVRRRRPSAPCGCFGSGGPVTWLLVGRAGFLAAGTAGAATALVWGFAHTATTAPMVVLAGAAVIAMAAWLVPVLPVPAVPDPAVPSPVVPSPKVPARVLPPGEPGTRTP